MRKKLNQKSSFNTRSITELGHDFCERLFSENMTPDQYQALCVMGFMILLDTIYDNRSKNLIIVRLEELEELYENKT